MEMTVSDLIAELEKIKDKDKKVKLSVNDEIAGHFHIRESSPLVFLSNYGEDDYKTKNTI